VCEVDPLDIEETIRESVLVPGPDETGQLAYCSYSDTFTVLPKDTPHDKEGLQ